MRTRFLVSPAHGAGSSATCGTTIVAVLAALLLASTFPPALAQDRLLMVATDYTTANLAAIALSPPHVVECDLVPVCPDAVLRWHGGLIYVVNRYGCDNVQVIDPASWTILHEWSVGIGSNPQDIAVITPTRAYVSRYETNDLLEFNPATGATLGTISLSAFADADGLCEMHRMQLHGNRLFVQVQRMYRQEWPDPWLPSPPSLLVVIDLTSRQIVDADPAQPGTQGIPLAGLNPIAPIQVDIATGKLLVSTAGQYGVIDAGGIERVDPVRLRSEGFVVSEATLGGDLVDFAQWSAARAYAIVSLPGFSTALVSYQPSSGELLGVVYNSGSYTLADLLTYPTGRLFVSDRDYFHPGIRVYSVATGALLAGPISTCLPPNDLIVLPGATSGLPDEAAGTAGDWLGDPYPNPSRGGVRLGWSGAAGGVDRGDGAPAGDGAVPADGGVAEAASVPVQPVRLEVFDVYGRRVRSEELGSGPGAADIEWDGTDAAGHPVPAGVYFLRIVLRADREEFPVAARAVRIVR